MATSLYNAALVNVRKKQLGVGVGGGRGKVED